MEYRILNRGILNIEGTDLPEKSDELIFLSLPEGHRFLSRSNTLARFQLYDMGKTSISLWRETGFSSAIIQREDSESNQARVHLVGTRGSYMHSERDVRNQQDIKSSLEGGGLRSECEARRRVLAFEANESLNSQHIHWHQHPSRLKPYSLPREIYSRMNSPFSFKTKNLSPLNIYNHEN